MRRTDVKGTDIYVTTDNVDEETIEWEPPRTVRDQQMESAYHQALWDALNWIKACTAHTHPNRQQRPFQIGEFRRELSDGIQLCELLNALKPGSIRRINRLKISMAAGLDNLATFISACQSTFGLSRLSMFEIADVVEDVSERFKPEEALHEDERRCKKILDCLVRLYRQQQQQQQQQLPQLALGALQLLLGESASTNQESNRRQSLRPGSSSEPAGSTVSAEHSEMARRQAENTKQQQQQQQQQRRSVNSFDDDGEDDAGWLESLSNWKEKRRRSLHNSLPRLNLVEELRRADEEAESESATAEAKEKNRPLSHRMQQRAKSVNGLDSDTEDDSFEQVIEAKATVSQSYAIDNHQAIVKEPRLHIEAGSSKDETSHRPSPQVSRINHQDDLKDLNGQSSSIIADQHRQASTFQQSSAVRFPISKKKPAPQPPSQPPQQPKQQQQQPPPPPPLKPKPQTTVAAPAAPPAAPATLQDAGASLSARERLFLSNVGGSQQSRWRLHQQQQRQQHQQPLVRSRSTDALDAILTDADRDDDSAFFEAARRPSPEQRQQQQRSEFQPLAASKFGPPTVQQKQQDQRAATTLTTPRAAKSTDVNEEHAPVRAVNNPLMFSAEQNNLMRKSLPPHETVSGAGKPDALRSLSNGVERTGVRPDFQQSHLQQKQHQQLQQEFLQPSNDSLMKILQNRVLFEQHQEQRHNRNLRRQQLKQRSRSAERRTGSAGVNVHEDDKAGVDRRAAALTHSQPSPHQQQHLQQQNTTRFSTEVDTTFGSPAHLRAIQQHQQQQQQQQHHYQVSQEVPVVVKDSRMRLAAAPTGTMTVGRQPRPQNRPPPAQQQQQQHQQQQLMQQLPPGRGTAAGRGPLPAPPLPPRGVLDSVVRSRANGWGQQHEQLVSSRQLCSHCHQELGSGAAMAIESLQLFYHVKCFRCSVCNTPLGNGSAGADVRVRREQLHCPSCFSSDEGAKFSCV